MRYDTAREAALAHESARRDRNWPWLSHRRIGSVAGPEVWASAVRLRDPGAPREGR